MVNPIGEAVKAGIKYTKNGCRLISKQNVLPNTVSASLVPDACKSVEIIEAETHFGRGISTVFSFLGEDGKPLKKILTKVHAGKSSMTTREYEVYERALANVEQDKVLFTSTSFTENGVLVKKNKETFFAYKMLDGKTKAMKRIKLEMFPNSDGSRFERQIYEDWYPFAREYLETSATRLKDGRIVDKTISGNVKGLEELQKDPYLYMRNYDKEDFALSASWYAQLRQKVAGLWGDFSLGKLKGNTLGEYQHANMKVTVDCEKHSFITDLVDTINHEYRHKYQHSLVDKLARWNIFRNKKMLTSEEEFFAKKLKVARKNYCQPEVDYDRYHSNFMEVDARKAGSEAANEYGTYSRRLAVKFFMPSVMLHAESTCSALSDFVSKAIRDGKVTKVSMPIFEH